MNAGNIAVVNPATGLINSILAVGAGPLGLAGFDVVVSDVIFQNGFE